MHLKRPISPHRLDEVGANFERERLERPLKRAVLQYLRSCEPKYRSSYVFDPVQGRTVDLAEAAYEQDGWSWTESDVYLFDKYNLKLDQSFLERFGAD